MVNIAVLMATYNGERFIREQIESILSNTGYNYEFFVSDDGSIDDTLEIINSFRNVKFHISRGPCLGSPGLNFLSLLGRVDYNRFDYVAIADQDDIWTNDKIQKSILYLTKNHAAAVSSDITAFWENGREKYLRKSYPTAKYDYFFESAGPGCTYFLKQKTAKNLKIFIDKHWCIVSKIKSHDWFIYAFVRNSGEKWVIIPESTLLYRQHQVNVAGANLGLLSKLRRLKAAVCGWYQDDLKILLVLFNHPEHLSYATSPSTFYQFFKLLLEHNNLRRRPIDKIQIVPLLIAIKLSTLLQRIRWS